MTARRQTHTVRQLLVDITPMIDVVFLLIIFFMTAAQISQENREALNLPVEMGEQDENPDEAGIVINISADGRIIVAGELVDLDTLESIVRDEAAATDRTQMDQTRVLIRADREAPAGRLNQVVTRLQKIGVGSARLGTEIP